MGRQIDIYDHKLLPLGLAFSFIVVVVFLNPVLKKVNRKFGLTGDELGIVLMTLLAAVSVPTYGITGYVISVSASPLKLFND